MNPTVILRPETDADHEAVYAVHAAAFDTTAEARLVTALRARARPLVSVVAEAEGAVVGHLLCSPMRPVTPAGYVMGLAPMAVTPARQRQGIGGALVRAGLDACRALGAGAVVVLGHPSYYPRFGFVPASRFGLRCPYDVPDEVFMALELHPDALHGISGLLHYHPAFDTL